MIRKAKVEIRKASGGKDPIEREGNQMKAILISIQPKYVADILNGKKTLEIRKTLPKCDLPIDVYVYCTKDNNASLHKNIANIWWIEDKEFRAKNRRLGIKQQPIYNGKVVAKFTLNKVEDFAEECSRERLERISKGAYLNILEMLDYIGNKVGYAWHIDNLVVFDKPKEISEFRQWFDCEKCWCVDNQDYLMNKQCPKHTLTRAPQSWQFIEV